MLLEYDRFYGLGVDALMTVCSWGTTRTLLGSGHGCSNDHMLLEHEHYHGFGMDALVTVCSRNTNVITRVIMVLGMDALMTVCSWTTNVIMVWAWMLW